MAHAVVNRIEFEGRLAALGLRGHGSGMPRRLRDRHIVFRSASQALDPAQTYAETEVNLALQAWLAGLGSSFDVDHVTLRRELVDAGYLVRDAFGSRYQVRLLGNGTIGFDDEVAHVDTVSVIEAAREQAAVKKDAALLARAASQRANS